MELKGLGAHDSKVSNAIMMKNIPARHLPFISFPDVKLTEITIRKVLVCNPL